MERTHREAMRAKMEAEMEKEDAEFDAMFHRAEAALVAPKNAPAVAPPIQEILKDDRATVVPVTDTNDTNLVLTDSTEDDHEHVDEDDLLTRVEDTLRVLGRVPALDEPNEDNDDLKSFLSLAKTYNDLWDEQSELFEKNEEYDYENLEVIVRIIENLQRQKLVLTECAEVRGKLSDSDKNRLIETLPDNYIEETIKNIVSMLGVFTEQKQTLQELNELRSKSSKSADAKIRNEFWEQVKKPSEFESLSEFGRNAGKSFLDAVFKIGKDMMGGNSD